MSPSNAAGASGSVESSGRKFGAMSLFKGMLGVMTVAYPFLVYFSLDRLEPRLLGLLLAALLLLRWLGADSRSRGTGALAVLLPAGAVFMALAGLSNQEVLLLSYPLLVSAVFLAIFAYSLYRPPSIVERIARLSEPNLTADGIAYTRKVTRVWCGFFVVNGLVSSLTIWHGDRLLWTLYNGCLAYLLMGALMAGEMAVRRKLRGRI